MAEALAAQRVILPDNRSIDFPDDATPEEIQTAIGAMMGGESDTDVPPTVPPQPEFTQEAREGPSLARRIGTPDAFRNAGGLVGGVLAAPAAVASGPLLPAVEIGGMALGAAAGQALYQNYDELLDLIEGTPDKDSIFKTFMDPINAGLEEAAFSSIIPGGRSFIRGVGWLLTRPGKEAVEAAKLGERTGIPVGAVDVTSSKMVRGVPRVLGVFPFAGSPFRNLKETQRVGAFAGRDNILNSLAPNVTLEKAGVDVARAAEDAFESFKNVSAANYLRFYEEADKAPVKEIFPTTPIRNAAFKMIQELSDARPVLMTPKKDPKTGVLVDQKLERPVDDPVEAYAAQLLDLPEYLTAKQVRQIKFDLESLFRKAGTEGFDTARLTQLAEAQEASLQAIRADKLPPGEGERILKILSDANAYHKDMLDLFRSPTGQQIGRVDKNIFKPGAYKPGSLNADEIATTIFNAKSPQAVRDLRRIAGDENFQVLSRKWMEDSFNKGVLTREIGGNRVQVLDPVKIEEALGLAGKQTRANRESLEEMLKGTDVKLYQIEDLIQAMKNAGNVVVPDPSTYLGRRFVLAGAMTAESIMSPLRTPVATLALLSFTRSYAKSLSNPEALKAMTGMLDPKLDGPTKRMLALRVIRALGTAKEDEGEPAQ